jgi:hypothetical protein
MDDAHPFQVIDHPLEQLTKAFGALHQQLHRLLSGRTFLAFQHLLFVPG